MPGFDGTGPRGSGPMTGSAGGYCLLKVPDVPGEMVTGLAGKQGKSLTMTSLSSKEKTLEDLKLQVVHSEVALKNVRRRINALESGQAAQKTEMHD